jgi:NADH-quinone oxidoreductase subunit G
MGFNPRLEAPVVNIKLREAVAANRLKVYSFFSSSALNYRFTDFGSNVPYFLNFLAGKSLLSRHLLRFNSPVGLFGSALLNAVPLVQHLAKVLEGITRMRFFYFPSFASTVGLLEFGANSSAYLYRGCMQPRLDIFYSFAFDEIAKDASDVSALDVTLVSRSSLSLHNSLLIYQGSHGDRGAELAHLVLPSSLHTETSSFYINAFGQSRWNRFVLSPEQPWVRSDSSIVGVLSSTIRETLAILSAKAARPVSASHFYALPSFSQLVVEARLPPSFNLYLVPKFLVVQPLITEFYLTSAITRSSHNLALASALQNSRLTNFN